MKKKLSIIFASIILILTCCFGLVACNNTNQTTIKFAVPDGAPAIAVTNIVKDGLTLDKNQKLQLDITNPKNVIDSIKAKKLDMAILPTNVATMLYTASVTKNDNDPYVMLATATYGNLYILGNSTSATFEQMIGKIMYAIGKGAIPGKVLEKVLTYNNIPFVEITKEEEKDSTKLNIMYVNDGPAVIQKMNSSKDEVFGMLADPAVTLQKKQGKKLCYDMQKEYQIATKSEVLGYPQAVLIARKSFIASNKTLVEQVVTKMQENVAFINNPENQTAGLETILQNNTFGTSSALKKIPAPSVKGCNIVVKNSNDAKNDIIALLANLSLKPVADDFFYDLAK